MDVLEVSTTGWNGEVKVSVIGDLFSRFVWAKSVEIEKSETMGETIFDEWMLRFVPPDKLLSDRGKPFTSNIINFLCQKIGTRKIFTSPYHPQTDLFVE